MDLTEVKDAIKGLNPTEWQTLYLWAITEEKPRRDKETALEEGAATLLADLREQGALPTPVKTAAAPDKHTPWKTPKGDKTKMYLYGDRVFQRRPRLGITSPRPQPLGPRRPGRA